MSRLSECCKATLYKDPIVGNYCSNCIRKANPAKNARNMKIAAATIVIILLLFSPDLRAPLISGMGIVPRTFVKAVEMFDSDVELNDSSITTALIRQKCVLPNVALAQFKAETTYDRDRDGHYEQYSSPVCTDCKNLAGIRFKVKGSYGIGFTNDTLHYVIYASYRDCIRDYVKIQDSYLSKIQGRYASDGNYTNVIRGVR